MARDLPKKGEERKGEDGEGEKGKGEKEKETNIFVHMQIYVYIYVYHKKTRKNLHAQHQRNLLRIPPARSTLIM